MIAISVIICTHNPRPHYFRRVLEALRQQTLPVDQWELLLVDNASTDPLEKWADVSWHPRARHIREMTLGVAWARIRGISEAQAELLLFVDDDNVLDRDYLAHAKAIATEHPKLGAWSGNSTLEFEAPPPDWTKSYWPLLAARDVPRDAIGCSSYHDPATTPIGAGMCFRRKVGLHYRDLWLKSPIRKVFGARGQTAILGEDTDLALTATDLGMDSGVFARLKLTHLMPPQRLTEQYLRRLHRGVSTASLLMRLVRNVPPRRLPQGFKWWIKTIYDCARKWGRKRRFYLAGAMGKRDALRIFNAAQAGQPDEDIPQQARLPRQHHPAG
jgi:glycosyltransferase involved in cell wall biosynthesis